MEPVRGQYNQTYLDISRGIIQKLQDNGIYTLVDQHQDVWSAQTCGHGAPLVTAMNRPSAIYRKTLLRILTFIVVLLVKYLVVRQVGLGDL